MTFFTSISRVGLLLGLSLLCSPTKAQYDCNNERFLQEVFTDVTVTSNVVYGSAITYSGTTQSLVLDVYEPTGDAFTVRPLIVFAHGGSFIFGDKASSDMVTLCTKYAKLGYVCASINYRLGYQGLIPNSNTAKQTVYRATSDMRAAIRYFRKDYSTDNLFRIDTTNIYAAGVSAGAFMAVHLGYLDQPEEIPSAVDPVAYGGIEGFSGNDGYSSKVKAIVNLCGALGDTSWINIGDVPFISMHGTVDDVVPYGTAVINVLGVNLFEVDGSRSIALRQEHLGLRHEFVSWNGAAHVPFVNSSLYMDSVFMAVTPFLAEQLGCDVPNGMEEASKSTSLNIFPNPANDLLTIRSNEAIDRIELIDLQGRVLWSIQQAQSTQNISLSSYDKGIYLMRIWQGKSLNTKKIVHN